MSRIAVDNGDPDKVIPISFNALAQYRLAMDYITESVTLWWLQGVVHRAQKGLDPDLKPESQSKSNKTLLQLTVSSPMKTSARSPILGHTPEARSPMSRTPKTPLAPRTIRPSLLNSPINTNFPRPTSTPRKLQTPHNLSYPQTPLGSQLITKTNLSPAQAVTSSWLNNCLL